MSIRIDSYSNLNIRGAPKSVLITFPLIINGLFRRNLQVSTFSDVIAVYFSHWFARAISLFIYLPAAVDLDITNTVFCVNTLKIQYRQFFYTSTTFQTIMLDDRMVTCTSLIVCIKIY
jgi:hypothetical protein